MVKRIWEIVGGFRINFNAPRPRATPATGHGF
ncbi:uncharacterized protein G2W53_019879 [Senna tora]|uniref:Uncharacterized protein n=1 Tax=Senna tora TaxID=362788 RepID=A0A834TZ25_9FABA|nr:uncharacterized protein G2W53_019879 [Senna tora]